MAEQRVLRTWRERIATPLKAPGDDVSEEVVRQNAKRGQNPVSPLVGIGETCTAKTPDISAKTSVEHAEIPSSVGNLSGFQPGLPYFEQIGPTTWVETAWARARCVFCPRPLADGDLICCADHRQQMEAD
jgi:hypothetical protein